MNENVVFYEFFHISSAVFTGTSEMGGVSLLDKQRLAGCFY